MDFIFDEDVDEVGADVEAFCPKCKADTAHVVISKYEEEIRRVQCNPCGDVHPYRKPRGDVDDEIQEPVSAKKKAAKVKPTWDQMMAKAKKEPRLYVVAEAYKENELVSHPKFGTGFVSEVIAPDKIEVTFQSERRILIHNRQGMSLPPAAYAHPVDGTRTTEGAGGKSAKGKGKGGKAAPVAPAPVAKQPAKAASQPAPAGKAGKSPTVKAPDKGAKPAAAKGALKPAATAATAKSAPAKAAPVRPMPAKAAAKPVPAKKPAAKPAPKAPAKKPAAKPVAAKPAVKAAAKPAAKKPAAKPTAAKKATGKKR